MFGGNSAFKFTEVLGEVERESMCSFIPCHLGQTFLFSSWKLIIYLFIFSPYAWGEKKEDLSGGGITGLDCKISLALACKNMEQMWWLW